MKNSDRPAMPNKLYNNKAMNGLTKREHFAGLAMQGLLASDYKDCSQKMDKEDVALMAVLHADALLKELEKDE